MHLRTSQPKASVARPRHRVAAYSALAWLVLAGMVPPAMAYAEAPVSNAPKLRFLTPDAVQIASVISAAPAPGSAVDQLDNGVLRLQQSNRSVEDCARAAAEVVHSLDNFFGPARGPLTAAEVSRLDPLFSQLVGEIKFFSNQGKGIWHRPRPYDEDRTLVPCVEKESTFAYPSGHATVSKAFAQILSKAFPERAQAFQVAADHVAIDRVISGLHHPSDVLAGQTLGVVIGSALLQNSKFSAALDAVAKAP